MTKTTTETKEPVFAVLKSRKHGRSIYTPEFDSHTLLQAHMDQMFGRGYIRGTEHLDDGDKDTTREVLVPMKQFGEFEIEIVDWNITDDDAPVISKPTPVVTIGWKAAAVR